MSSQIERYGWRFGGDTAGIARITSAHGDYFHIVCDEVQGEIIARRKKSAFLGADAIKPMTGDFVRFRHNPHGESFITEVLRRYSYFERRDPTARRKAQMLAVNFDYLFIMMNAAAEFSRSRLERYLSLAEDVGEAAVLAVFTKCDLAEPAYAELSDGIRALAISSKSGEGLDAVRELARPGKTVALIGASGVGKSSLVNALAGGEWMATQEVQEWSGKGRHTTTSRELVMLPSGAMMLDTPGIREIGMVGEQDVELVKGAASHRWRVKGE